jgi:hypothetical protein
MLFCAASVKDVRDGANSGLTCRIFRLALYYFCILVRFIITNAAVSKDFYFPICIFLGYGRNSTVLKLFFVVVVTVQFFLGTITSVPVVNVAVDAVGCKCCLFCCF